MNKEVMRERRYRVKTYEMRVWESLDCAAKELGVENSVDDREVTEALAQCIKSISAWAQKISHD